MIEYFEDWEDHIYALADAFDSHQISEEEYEAEHTRINWERVNVCEDIIDEYANDETGTLAFDIHWARAIDDLDTFVSNETVCNPYEIAKYAERVKRQILTYIRSDCKNEELISYCTNAENWDLDNSIRGNRSFWNRMAWRCRRELQKQEFASQNEFEVLL